MDIEKLIHCLQCCVRVDAHNIGCDDCGLEYCGPECQQLCGTAATALSTLQAENEKLRAELGQVKRERDAAECDLKYLGDCVVCKYNKVPCLREDAGHKTCFQWRGQKED